MSAVEPGLAAYQGRLAKAKAAARPWNLVSGLVIGCAVALMVMSFTMPHAHGGWRLWAGAALCLIGAGFSLAGAKAQARYLRDHREGR